MVDAFRFDIVPAAVELPHPRYPDSSPESPVTPPTTGNVGSWFGLKPYASISFRLSSSSTFLCFLRLHRNRPPKTRSATATIGITTAIAIFPDEDSPPESLLGLEVADEVALPRDAVFRVDEVSVFADGVLTCVTTTVDGG